MIRITLDTNCVIKALNPMEEHHQLIKSIIGMHSVGGLEIQVVAAAATENGRDLDRLQNELNKLQLKNIRILPIPLIVSFSHLGYAYLADEEIVNDLKKIWSTLFPGSAFNHEEFLQPRKITIYGDDHVDKNWCNRMCDTLTVFEYIRDCMAHSRAENLYILVTSDGDHILKNAEKLAGLGAGMICNIPQAVNIINQNLTSDSNVYI
jgi:hypothetical protein